MATIIKPDDQVIAAYQRRLNEAREGTDTQHEGNIRHAFANLLEETARRAGWTLVQEHSVRTKKSGGRIIRYDGMLRDEFFPHGHWEAKDSDDDLEREIEAKRGLGYSFENIIFEDSREAVLYQRGERVHRAPVDDRERLAALLNAFYTYEIPVFRDFREALDSFDEQVPEIARRLKTKIEDAQRENRQFQRAFDNFMQLCRTALNPNIRREAVDEMLIQHLLTERLIRKMFDVDTFTQRNVIAAEIEKVITALSSQHFSRRDFLGGLNRFYEVIERAADEIDRMTDDSEAAFKEKQDFLNTVYERFFQGYSVKVADTHGIVYTPQEIVDFMSAAVQEVLKDEFDLDLGSPGVNILDPCTGTGNFIVNLLNRVERRDLERFYRQQLFANEVMLLPYYVASLNIEHAYYEMTGRYEPFEGVSFVDTLSLEETGQLSMFTEENTRRVIRQRDAKVNVVIGNPPYNVGQLDENDNNKNRTYKNVEEGIKATYAKDSKATNKNALYDAYVKFFRWATDRLRGRDGIVCFVTNNGFLDGIAFDGMRKHLLQDFQRVYHLDLGGNSRKSRVGETVGNVFGIRVGVGVTVAVRSAQYKDHRLYYHAVEDTLSAAEKLAFLARHVAEQGAHNALNTIQWQELTPDERHTWLIAEHDAEFMRFIPVGDKELKQAQAQDVEAIFKMYSRGLETTRDAWVYNFERTELERNVARMLDTYHTEMERWLQAGKPAAIDDFLDNDSRKIKWSSTLKRKLTSQQRTTFDRRNVRRSLYRPFSKHFTYFDDIMIHRPGQFPYFFPMPETEAENRVIALPGPGNRKGFGVFISNQIIGLDFAFEKVQCFPFYTYAEDGTKRKENITDWALAGFRAHYGDDSITKWDIFYYVYALLHHPGYRARYADNLKRDLPRIPFVPTPPPGPLPVHREGEKSSASGGRQTPPPDGDGVGTRYTVSSGFWLFSRAGKQLADLHLHYETVAGYRLQWDETKPPVKFRVEKMKLTDAHPQAEDDTYKRWGAVVVNDTLTLRGIPAAASDYRLGNRSALEWVVDQYRVKTDKRSGITSDPNRYSDDERYIVDLIERVVKVSVETVAIVNELAAVDFTPTPSATITATP